MPRYIDAEKIKLMGESFKDDEDNLLVSLWAIKQAIAKTPTEDVRKNKYTTLVCRERTYRDHKVRYVECDCCGEELLLDDYDYGEILDKVRYCHACGARVGDVIGIEDW